jgi:antitoxin component of MazEF toxin-antitoxin module
MARAEIRRILRVGGSLAIILPPSWTKGKVKAGDEMVVIADGDVRILPVHVAESAKDLSISRKGESGA